MTSGSEFRVTLTWSDGREEHVVASGDEPILDAAADAGISLPMGCLTGACATCTGKLLDGRVEHARQPRALKDRHLEAGYVLTCIAKPRSDCRLRVGADVQAELVENPWK